MPPGIVGFKAGKQDIVWNGVKQRLKLARQWRAILGIARIFSHRGSPSQGPPSYLLVSRRLPVLFVWKGR